MRIAHVDAETGFSGGELQVFLLMEGLRARGHENRLYCPPGSAAEAEARARGFAVEGVSMRNDLDLAAVLQLRRRLKGAGVDLVHLHTGRATWLGAWAAKLAHVPALSTRRMDRRVRRGPLTLALYGRLLRRVAAISPAVVRRLRKAGVREDRVVLIQSSIDPRPYERPNGSANLRRELGLGADTILLLTLAQLVHRKGIDVLLRACARLPRELSFCLAIAGDGPERSTLEGLARSLDLGSRVRFLGRRSDKPELLASVDLFVLPSRAEGLGVAALEAMAARRPVVASRVGGLGELVLDGITGLLVPPEDEPALCRAIATLVGDAALRGRMGQAGLERLSEGFLAEQMVAAYERLYGELLAEGSGR